MQTAGKPVYIHTLIKYFKEIKNIFEEFKDPKTNLMDVTDFLQTLKNTSVSKNCTLLLSKLERKQGQKLDEEHFFDLFNFNFMNVHNYYFIIPKQENFELLFNLIDQSGSGKIGKDELKKANNIYQLQLNDRDIEIMVNYSGSQEKDVISRDGLWALMASQNQ